MSSTIKLYEHNQKAYDALLDMLGERDRACVIKPTGTGKFVIIANMRWIPLAVFGRMNEGIRKGALLF